MKKEKEIRASFAVAPRTAKVTATVRDECIVKMEEALDLWVEDMNRKRVPIGSNVLRQKALTLYEDFSQGASRPSDTKPFTASKGWLYRFRNRFGLKNARVLDRLCLLGSSCCLFPAEVKKLIKEKGCYPKRVFNCDETGLFERCPIEPLFIKVQRRHQRA